MPLLRLGASSWSCKDWVGPFYETGTPPNEFIRAYARKFNTVEIDATFYAVPREATVKGWRERTPEEFLFSAKAPQVITHEKQVSDCDRELTHFLKVMSILGDRLGPILLQFPYFSRKSGMTETAFLDRLASFLPSLSSERQWAVEVRNKTWLGPALLDTLASNGVALALIDHPWMWRPDALFAMDGIQTGPFMYIRWLGDRYGIEKITKTWKETVVDRAADLDQWVTHIIRLLNSRVPTFGYVNNHYAGYAPDTLNLLHEALGKFDPRLQ